MTREAEEDEYIKDLKIVSEGWPGIDPRWDALARLFRQANQWGREDYTTDFKESQ